MSDLLQRNGKFLVSDTLVRDYPEKFLELVLSKVLVTRCEHRFDSGCFEYCGFSPLFDVWDMDCYPPEYQVELELHKTGDDEPEIRFVGFKRS